ncbi:MAG TPA: hypothetical protein VFP65_24200 [Anaeromyxobacteraceae bacterium]|nr:hypothetical protein [Anaeromyxobacteraceae bacterium]
MADDAQVTGLRIALPEPADCGARRSECEDVSVLNELDGFGVVPRVSIPFDGDVDVASVQPGTVRILRLGSAARERGDSREVRARDVEDAGGRAPEIELEEVIFEPATHTLHGHARTVLDQHARYLLVVTREVRDTSGRPIEASREFARFVRGEWPGGRRRGEEPDALGAYREELREALERASERGIHERDVAVASVFTTLSVSALLEHARARIRAGAPPRVDFDLLGTGDPRGNGWAVFPIDDIELDRNSFVFNADLGSDPSSCVRPNQPDPATGTCRVDLTNRRLALVRGGAVGRLALGRYDSPNYLDLATGAFGVHRTSSLPPRRGATSVYFNLFLPAGEPPAKGWPVVLFAYGSGDSKNGAPFNVAATFASHGLATLSINAPGHGLGPRGSLTIVTRSGGTVTVPSPGRGVDQDGNGTIDATEGFEAAPPRGGLTRTRDGYAQTAIDLMALVHAIDAGVDVDGDGAPDLDPSRIYLLGFSAGGGVALALHAVESAFRATVFNSPGSAGAGPGFSPLSRAQFGDYLAARQPPLVNAQGLTAIDGVGFTATNHFDENVLWRYEEATAPELRRQPIVNGVRGAMEIQEVFDRMEWACQPGGGLASAPLLRSAPLPGVPPRPFIVQFTRGDQQVFNPFMTRLLRSGGFADRATYIEYSVVGGMKNPHTIVLRTDSPSKDLQDLARAVQEQIAVFFERGDIRAPPATGGIAFETPVRTLPETLNYFP